MGLLYGVVLFNCLEKTTNHCLQMKDGTGAAWLHTAAGATPQPLVSATTVGWGGGGGVLVVERLRLSFTEC